MGNLTFPLVGQLDHVVHDAVMRQLVDSLEVALEAEGSADQFPLLFFDLYVDVVLNRCFQLWLKHLDLLVGPVGFPLPVGQVHLLLGHLFFILVHPVLIVRSVAALKGLVAPTSAFTTYSLLRLLGC